MLLSYGHSSIEHARPTTGMNTRARAIVHDHVYHELLASVQTLAAKVKVAPLDTTQVPSAVRWKSRRETSLGGMTTGLVRLKVPHCRRMMPPVRM